MNDELEELAAMASTKRQALIALGTGVVFEVALVALWFGHVISPQVFGVSVIGAVFVAAMIGRAVKTPASRLPAVQVLRERPAQVAYVVAMNRGGTRSLALVDREAALLAPPLVLKGNISKQSARAFAADRDDLARALAIIAHRSPGVHTASVSDHLGLASAAKLAKTAIAKLQA